MSRAHALILLLPLALLASSVGAAAPAATGEQPATTGSLAPAIEVEPRALGILQGASAKLAAAKTLSFKAVASEESPTRLGPALDYYTTSEVTLHRPDKLRVLSPGDGPRNEFYYDGKTMTAYSPADNYVATASAPATIDAMLEQAFSMAQIYFPFEDLLVANPYRGHRRWPAGCVLRRRVDVCRRHQDTHRCLRGRPRVRAGLDRRG